MSGETNLETLLQNMQPVLDAETYVFAKTNDASMARQANARMTFHEEEAITLIMPQEDAETLGLQTDFPCRMITLNIHSSLDAVGFLARITTALAALNMGVNPVSAFHHDHLFVPADRIDDAMAALNALTNP